MDSALRPVHHKNEMLKRLISDKRTIHNESELEKSSIIIQSVISSMNSFIEVLCLKSLLSEYPCSIFPLCVNWPLQYLQTRLHHELFLI